MKITVFTNADEVEDFVCKFGSEATLRQVQFVFHEWMRLPG
jgi:hypothetical protein